MSYKKTLLLSACFSAIWCGGAHADTTSKDVLIRVGAQVVPESCYKLSMDDSNGVDEELPDIPIKEVQILKKNNASKLVNFSSLREIKFECSSGSYANFSVHISPDDKCITDHGFPYTCSGENKSVNIAPVFRWTDKENLSTEIKGFHHDQVGRVQTVKLNGNVGVINFPGVYIRTTKGVDPLPGYLEGRFIIKVWEP